jgi:Flagellar biosynthesis pathway, component FlhA
MATRAQAMTINYKRFTRQGDFLLAGGVIMTLFVMLVPLPTIILDILLAFSISFSLVILITSMFMTSPLEFSISLRSCW